MEEVLAPALKQVRGPVLEQVWEPVLEQVLGPVLEQVLGPALEQTLKQELEQEMSWLPGGGQLGGGSCPSMQVHGVAVGEEGEKEQEGGGERGGREGEGGTWVTKGAVQMDIGHASTGGEVQGGLPTLAPD